MKSLGKKVDKEELNETALMQELKQSIEEMERVERENKLLSQTTGRMLDSADREADTFPWYVK